MTRVRVVTSRHISILANAQDNGLMAYINYAPTRIGTEDPWTLTELAKAGGGPGGLRPPGFWWYPYLGNFPLRALVCDGAIT